MDNAAGGLLGPFMLLFLVGIAIGLFMTLPFVVMAVLTGLNHLLTLIVGACIKAIRARRTARAHARAARPIAETPLDGPSAVVDSTAQE